MIRAAGASVPTSLRRRQDDLGLADGIEHVREVHHRDDQPGRGAVVGRNRAKRRDGSLEAGVDRLEAVASRPLEDHGEPSGELILRDHDLVDPVTVEVHRSGAGSGLYG